MHWVISWYLYVFDRFSSSFSSLWSGPKLGLAIWLVKFKYLYSQGEMLGGKMSPRNMLHDQQPGCPACHGVRRQPQETGRSISYYRSDTVTNVVPCKYRRLSLVIIVKAVYVCPFVCLSLSPSLSLCVCVFVTRSIFAQCCPALWRWSI